MNCAICNSQETKRLFNKNSYWILACNCCGHRFVDLHATQEHVKNVYSDKYFQDGEDGYLNYLDENEILIKHGQRYGKLLSRYMEPADVLDVGAAAGFILRGLTKLGWKGMGIEPNTRMAEFGFKKFKLKIFHGAFEDFAVEKQFDLVTMIQVIAHFYDLRKALHRAAMITKPGGFLLIETWNRDSWSAKILKNKWHEYNPPSVLHFFSPNGLQRMMAQFGFSKIAMGRPIKLISGKHTKSILKYNVKASKLMQIVSKTINMIPDQLVIPYPAEDLFWMLFKNVEQKRI